MSFHWTYLKTNNQVVKFRLAIDTTKGLEPKGHVKLIQQVKIAHSFLQSVSNLFHFIILSFAI